MSYRRIPLSHMQRLIFRSVRISPLAGTQRFGFQMPATRDYDDHLRALSRDWSRAFESERTTFHADGGEIVGHLHDERARPVDSFDTRNFSECEVIEAFDNHVAACPPVLAESPAGRLCNYWVDAEQCFTFRYANHIVHDADSGALYYRYRNDYLTSIATGHSASIPVPECNYRDYVRWETELLASVECTARLSFWKETLRGIKPLAFPRALPSEDGRTASLVAKLAPVDVIPDATATRFFELAARHGFSYFDACCAAYACVLSGLAKQSSVVVGVPFSLRSVLPQFRGTAGNMLDYIPVRIDVIAGWSALDLIRSVRRAKRASITNYIPLGYLLDHQRLEWESSPTPILQCLINMLPSTPGSPPFLLNRPGDEVAASSGRLRMLNLLGKPAVTLERQDVTLLAVNYEGQLRFRLGARTDVFDDASVASLQADFHRLMCHMLDTPEERVSELMARALDRAV